MLQVREYSPRSVNICPKSVKICPKSVKIFPRSVNIYLPQALPALANVLQKMCVCVCIQTVMSTFSCNSCKGMNHPVKSGASPSTPSFQLDIRLEGNFSSGPDLLFKLVDHLVTMSVSGALSIHCKTNHTRTILQNS